MSELSNYKFFDKESLFFFGNHENKEIKLEDMKPSVIDIEPLCLFLAEMQLFVYYLDISQCNNILYINTGNKKHLLLLAQLFPSINFHIYSETIDKELFNKYNNVFIYMTVFDNQSVLEWSNKNFPIGIISYKDNESYSQRIIIEKLNPYIALVDFEPEGNEYEFLEGELLRPIFSPVSYTSRLIVRGVAYKTWDVKNYKNYIDYHHCRVRPYCKFLNPFSNDHKTIYKERGLYNYYDETSLMVIIIDYLKKINQTINFNNIIAILIFILDNIHHSKKINLDIERIIS